VLAKGKQPLLRVLSMAEIGTQGSWDHVDGAAEPIQPGDHDVADAAWRTRFNTSSSVQHDWLAAIGTRTRRLNSAMPRRSCPASGCSTKSRP
jgi:hypothetical protein